MSEAQPGLRQMMQMMQAENGIAEMLQRPVYVPDEDGNPTVSQADVIADLFNMARLDLKRLGEAVGADITAERMTPEVAAMLMQDMVRNESLDIVDRFNDLEDKRETILAEFVDEDELEVHRETKARMAYSRPDVGGKPGSASGAAENEETPGVEAGETAVQDDADGATDEDADDAEVEDGDAA